MSEDSENAVVQLVAEPADKQNLRDRIAYAIAQADGDLPGMEPAPWDYELADAVIEALKLTEDGGVIVGCIHD
jgi:hypothetical protein